MDGAGNGCVKGAAACGTRELDDRARRARGESGIIKASAAL
jgi:hypothetical protein